jgi:hypothetical protein
MTAREGLMRPFIALDIEVLQPMSPNARPLHRAFTLAKGRYIERGALLKRLAAEWGVSIAVTPWQRGGV